MADYQEASLESINGGAALEMFRAELEKVLENIRDPNTKADAPREIALRLKIKPSKNRETATTSVSVASKLAPIDPHESMLLFSFDGNKVKAWTTDINQPELTTEDGKVISMEGHN